MNTAHDSKHLAKYQLIGFFTLFKKEVMRFWKVAFQTITAPVITALLYLLIFGHVLKESPVGQLSYAQFLVPGLAMMSLLQNAFANSSSSIIQSKITGNLVYILLSPLTPIHLFWAYVLASVCRGILVALVIIFASYWVTPPHMAHPIWVAGFAFVGSCLMGSLGMIAGIWAEKFDQLAAFQNFFITPMTMLAGVFYSVKSLPSFWATLSHLNPFFYLIDGFRYGFLNVADVSPWHSLSVAIIATVVTSVITLAMLKKGYKIKH